MDTVLTIFLLSVLSASALSFSWNSCSSSSDPIKITKLRVSKNNRELLINGKAHVRVNLTSPIKGKLQIRRKAFMGWTKIPCIDNIGSCTYDDICEFGQDFEGNNCPKIFKDNHLPCHCPITKRSYSAKKFPISLDRLPEWLGKGEYRVRGALYSKKNQQLLCLNVEITI